MPLWVASVIRACEQRCTLGDVRMMLLLRSALKTCLLLTLCLGALAACSLPRGGPLQSEVLRAQKDTGKNSDIPKDFVVYKISKDLLPQVATWPRTGPRQITSWINHAHIGGDPVIQRGDLINLTIWDSQQNSLLTNETAKLVELKQIQVQSDGRIFIPYLDRIKVSGMTAERARSNIQDRLESIVSSAQVQLSIEQGQASSVGLVSGVAKPGLYPLATRHSTVLDMISIGGGISPDLRNPQIRLQRAGRTYGISARKLYTQPKFDTILKGRDKIIVEQDNRYFRAFGAALTESLVYFESDHVTASDALSQMGGLLDNRANPQGILILRNYSASQVGTGRGPAQPRVIFTIDLTTTDGLFSASQFKIHPKDTVLVTESPLNVATTIFGLIGSISGFVQ